MITQKTKKVEETAEKTSDHFQLNINITGYREKKGKTTRKERHKTPVKLYPLKKEHKKHIGLAFFYFKKEKTFNS